MDKVLCLVCLPPPIHGASTMAYIIKTNKTFNEAFEVHYINTHTSANISDIGRIRIVKLFSVALLLLKLIFELIFFRPDKVYFSFNVTGLGFFRDFTYLMVIKLFRKTTFLHFHTKGIQFNSKRLLYNLAFSNVSIILLSPKLYSEIEKYVMFDDVYFCPNGIRLSNSPMIGKIVEEPVGFVFLSNLIRSKGILELIEACRILADRNIKFKCTIIGASGDIGIEEIEETCKELNLGKQIEILGPVFGDEKSQILSKQDCLVLPTYYSRECFPLVLLEAMAHGLALISTDEGAIEDIVGPSNGFLVKPQDAQDLAAKMQSLIDNHELLGEMKNYNLRSFRDRYTEGKFIQRLVEILE